MEMVFDSKGGGDGEVRVWKEICQPMWTEEDRLIVDMLDSRSGKKRLTLHAVYNYLTWSFFPK